MGLPYRKGAQPSISPDVSLLLRMYELLRDEILNSISWQHRLMMGEATILSALLALGFSIKEWGTLVVAVPPAVLVLSSAWMVEQTRMMRAGDFLQLLEHRINIEMKNPLMIWENWLRRPGVRWYDPHRIHHISQYVAVIGVFHLLGFFTSIFLWYNPPGNLPLTWCRAYCVIFAVLLAVLLVLTIRIVVHERRYPMEEFLSFCREYKEQLSKMVEEIRDLQMT